MNKEERELRLKTLVGHLVSKYSLSHHSISHLCFKIKLEDVKDIVKDYQDVISDSNLFMSKYDDTGNFSINSDKFKVSTSDRWLMIESQEYEFKNHFKTYIKMTEVYEIEVDISCGEILSFHFNDSDKKHVQQISFRKD